MRIVGLDIQASRVSAVEIDTGFGRFEIRDTRELPVLENTTPEATAVSLLESLSVKPGRVVCAVPAEISTFRNLQIASRDKKAVRSALEFELEDDLPFEKDNLHYDGVTLTSSQQGSTIHVGAVKKASFKTYLENLNSAHLDPEIITTSPWAYRSLIQRIEPNVPIMLVGIERDKTFIYIHYQNKPVLYREIHFGIQDIEKQLSVDFDTTPGEIHSWIRDVGIVDGINEKVSNSIETVLELVVLELKQSELAARSILQRAVIDQVWVTGEGALIPGIIPWLELASEKKASLFRPLNKISPTQLSYSDVTETHFSKALALGMSVISADKLQPINLRKALFIKTSLKTASVWEMIRKPLPYLAITAFVFFATKSIEYQYYKGRLVDTDELLKKSVKNYFANTTGSALSDGATRNYLADTTKLSKTIQSDLAKQRELSKIFAPNNNSPFDFLKLISQKIAKDIVIDVVNFEAGTDLNDSYKENRPFKANLSILVSNPQMIAKITDILEKNFKLKKGNSEEVVQDGRKVFKIMFSGMIENSK